MEKMLGAHLRPGFLGLVPFVSRAQQHSALHFLDLAGAANLLSDTL